LPWSRKILSLDVQEERSEIQKREKMKRAVYLIISLLLLSGSLFRTGYLNAGVTSGRNDSVNVFVSPGLSSLAESWAEKFNTSGTNSGIRIITVSDQAQIAARIREGNSGIVTGDNIGSVKDAGWNVLVGRDVIVPIVSSANPFINELRAGGINTVTMAAFLKNENSRNWSTISRNIKDQKAELFVPADAALQKRVSTFFRVDESGLAGGTMKSSTDIINAVRKGPYAIGFCRFADLIDPSTKEIAAGICLLPIDRNGNGVIDFNESIYGNAGEFARGVWIGKYPKALVSNIYAVSAAGQDSKADLAFVKWILADGQKVLSANGYSDLLASERTAAIDGLNSRVTTPELYTAGSKLPVILLFIISTIILTGIIATTIARKKKIKKASFSEVINTAHGVLEQGSVAIPGGIYFDKTHTWAFMEEGGTVRVGIDDFLQHVTGKITRIRMKEEGSKVVKGEAILSIVQNGKQLNLYAPVSGTIVGHNQILDSDSSLINSSPYKNGWIYRIEPTNWIRESQLLFMAEKQREFIKKEFSRLKDFLMNALSGAPEYSMLLLQDGGEIADGVLSEMGPEVWDDFQTSFIDPSRQVWFYELF
jgi:glycine cleavage system H lipoate-binding protein/ABC-type phosphate transport system substrate-binding protein